MKENIIGTNSIADLLALVKSKGDGFRKTRQLSTRTRNLEVIFSKWLHQENVGIGSIEVKARDLYTIYCQHMRIAGHPVPSESSFGTIASRTLKKKRRKEGCLYLLNKKPTSI